MNPSPSDINTVADTPMLALRRQHFPDRVMFHAPGLKRYQTSEYTCHDATEFVSVSLTGTACALSCEHCKTAVLRGMRDLRRSSGSLFDTCAELAANGARGILISGGSDKQGRVPLLQHADDLIRVRRELGLLIRVHPGLPDEETCAALAEIGIDGAMVDIIGHDDTIRDVYHLDATTTDDYAALLERLQRHQVPMVPHIILGLHYGQFLGERYALEMIRRYPPKLLVLVILMPLSGTPMANHCATVASRDWRFFSTRTTNLTRNARDVRLRPTTG